MNEYLLGTYVANTSDGFLLMAFFADLYSM